MNQKEADLLNKIERLILETAEKNDWDEFVKFHIKQVVKCAEQILKLKKFLDTDGFIVLAGAWLHDIASISVPIGEYKKDPSLVHKMHHIRGCELSKKILAEILPEETVDKISQCVLRHRNSDEYPAVKNEEIIVAMADSMSHFHSICYFCHHFYYSQNSLEDMVNIGLRKLENDWRDVSIVPEVAELCRNEYETIKKCFLSYPIE